MIVADTQRFSTNLNLGSFPGIDSRKDPSLYNELIQIRNSIINLAINLDGYTGASAITATQFTPGQVPFGSSAGLVSDPNLIFDTSSNLFSVDNISTLALTAANSISTLDLTVTGTLTIPSLTTTGSISALNLTATGTVTTISLTATGTITTLNLTATGTVTTLNLTATNNLSVGSLFASPSTIGFFSAIGTPTVQPTTAIGSSAFVVNAGTAVNTGSTFDGYTIAQVVKALRTLGLLA